MRTATYKVGVASDRRRRKNVPWHILCFVNNESLKVEKRIPHCGKRRQKNVRKTKILYNNSDCLYIR